MKVSKTRPLRANLTERQYEEVQRYADEQEMSIAEVTRLALNLLISQERKHA